MVRRNGQRRGHPATRGARSVHLARLRCHNVSLTQARSLMKEITELTEDEVRLGRVPGQDVGHARSRHRAGSTGRVPRACARDMDAREFRPHTAHQSRGCGNRPPSRDEARVAMGERNGQARTAARAVRRLQEDTGGFRSTPCLAGGRGNPARSPSTSTRQARRSPRSGRGWPAEHRASDLPFQIRSCCTCTLYPREERPLAAHSGHRGLRRFDDGEDHQGDEGGRSGAGCCRRCREGCEATEQDAAEEGREEAPRHRR